MRGAQKVIKAFALALAVFLIVSMGVALIGGISFLVALSGGDEVDFGNSGTWVGEEFEENTVRRLELNVKATNVKFRIAEVDEPVRVETNNEYIMTGVDGDRLYVIEKSHGIFGWGGTGEVVVYVRKGTKFDEVDVEAGAGTLSIEVLETKRLKLELGAGKTRIEKLVASENVEIDGGAGLLEIAGGELRNARIELGAGKADITARLGGHSKVKSGVGRLELELVGKESDYRLLIDKGLGSVEYNGRGVSDGERIGDGTDVVDINSGVGSVDIRVTGE